MRCQLRRRSYNGTYPTSRVRTRFFLMVPSFFFIVPNDCSESVVFAVSVGGVTVVMFHTQDKAVPTRELMPFSAQR